METYEQSLYQRIVEVSQFINQTVRTVADIDPSGQATLGALPQVSVHLSDLRTMTETGTHKVMELAERIQDSRQAILKALEQLAATPSGGQLTPDARAHIASIQAVLADDDKRLLEIMTSLSFQDLVGQRVKKIVTIVEDVQRKLLETIVTFGQRPQEVGVAAAATSKADVMLKELEASKTTALKQDLVDDILGEFGLK